MEIPASQRSNDPGDPVRVPSYDDLTPGIPDVVDSESVEQLALFLRGARARRAQEADGAAVAPHAPPAGLYACLRLRDQSLDHPITTSSNPLLPVARDFSPRVMIAGAGEVLLDVSGLGRLIGEPAEIARQLARTLSAAGLQASVALAATQTAARLLAAARPGRSGSPASIAGLPVGLLKPLETLPPAMGHRDRVRPYETFERWGVATLGDLAALPAADLSSRLGRRGVALQRLARGLDATPFVPDGETPRYIGRLELEWPIQALEPLSFVFARLLEPLAVALERADRGAAAVHLDLRLTDRTTHARVLQLPAPMRDPRVLRTLLLLDLESHPPSPLCGFGETGTATAAVDIVTIELDPAPARITQFSLLQRALPSPETLSTLTARLAALTGESRIGSPALVDTHQPGAFVMARYAPDGAGGAKGALGAEGAGAGGADRAEGALVLRRQRQPPAIRVSVAHGRPVHLAATRRAMPQGAVAQAAGPWRTSGGWWKADTCRAGSDSCRAADRSAACRAEAVSPKPWSGDGGWNRDEWDVALTNGSVCRIFQDRTTQRWFLEGVYD